MLGASCRERANQPRLLCPVTVTSKVELATAPIVGPIAERFDRDQTRHDLKGVGPYLLSIPPGRQRARGGCSSTPVSRHSGRRERRPTDLRSRPLLR